MSFLFREELFFLRDWVRNNKYHPLAEREGSKFPLNFSCEHEHLAPPRSTQRVEASAIPSAWGDAAPRSARRKLSRRLRPKLKFYAGLSRRSGPWLRKGSWSHFSCCWPRHPTASLAWLAPFRTLSCAHLPTEMAQPARCCCSERSPVRGRGGGRTFGQGSGWEPSPFGSGEPLRWLTPSYETLPQDSCKRRNSTNGNPERRRQSSFFHLSLTFPAWQPALRSRWEEKGRKNNRRGHRCLIKV